MFLFSYLSLLIFVMLIKILHMYYSLTKEEVSNINHYYLHKVDKFFRMNFGSGSSLIEVRNNCFKIKIITNSNHLKTRSVSQISIEFLNAWLNNIVELQDCVYYSIDVYQSNPLGTIIGLDETNLETSIKLDSIRFKKREVLIRNFTNLKSNNLLNLLKTKLNVYSIDKLIHKVLITGEMYKFKHNIKSIIRYFVYDEVDFYKVTSIGIITFIKVDGVLLYNINYELLNDKTIYSVISYDTKMLNILNVELFKFVKFEGSKLLSNKLKELI